MTTIKKPTTKTINPDMHWLAPPCWLTEEVPPELIKVSCGGADAVTAVFARGGSTLWIGARAIDIGRDELGGDFILRAHNTTEQYMTAHDLATLAGMLMAAAIIQAHNEETNP